MADNPSQEKIVLDAKFERLFPRFVKKPVQAPPLSEEALRFLDGAFGPGHEPTTNQ